jgi:hypothetical protein
MVFTTSLDPMTTGCRINLDLDLDPDPDRTRLASRRAERLCKDLKPDSCG